MGTAANQLKAILGNRSVPIHVRDVIADSMLDILELEEKVYKIKPSLECRDGFSWEQAYKNVKNTNDILTANLDVIKSKIYDILNNKNIKINEVKEILISSLSWPME